MSKLMRERKVLLSVPEQQLIAQYREMMKEHGYDVKKDWTAVGTTTVVVKPSDVVRGEKHRVLHMSSATGTLVEAPDDRRTICAALYNGLARGAETASKGWDEKRDSYEKVLEVWNADGMDEETRRAHAEMLIHKHEGGSVQ